MCFYTPVQPVSHLMRRESARTLLSRNCMLGSCLVEHLTGLWIEQRETGMSNAFG
jgi:hypothetical protein